MKILHVLDHSIPLQSGYTFRTRAILLRQRRMGWETFHVTSAKHDLAARPRAAEEAVDGLLFYRTAPPRGWLLRAPLLNQYAVITTLERRLDELVTRIRPDILHAHSPALNGVAAVRVGKRRRIPVVYEIRAFWEDAAVDHGAGREWGPRYRLSRWLETYVMRRAAAVTTICEGLRGEITGRGIAPEKVAVVPNAVDSEQFTEAGAPDAALAAELGVAGRRVLGFIGSFYAYEGLAVLLDAMAALCRRRTDVHLLLVGGGPQAEELRASVARLGIGDHVTFAGRVPHDRVNAYYDLVDLFVYPRLSMRLTELVTPLKPLEAMAKGRIVLASDVGGHRELIRSGGNGRLFRAGDPGALAAAVEETLQHAERWPQMRAEGRRFVREERNWNVSVERYRKVYAMALGAGS